MRALAGWQTSLDEEPRGGQAGVEEEERGGQAGVEEEERRGQAGEDEEYACMHRACALAAGTNSSAVVLW